MMMNMITMSSPSLQFLQQPPSTQWPSFSHKIMKPVVIPWISKNDPSSLHIISNNTSFNICKTPMLLHSAIHESSEARVGVELDLQEQEDHRLCSRMLDIEGNLLSAGLRIEAMPKHVGVVLDGNMRWAKENNLPPAAVHERLLPNLADLCLQCIRLGIPVLSAFIFSTQNWSRPRTEVEYLMHNYEKYIKAQLENIMIEGIRISFIGDLPRLPSSFQQVISEVKEATKNNSKLHLIYALGYSGQYDIMQACQSISDKVKDGLIQSKEVNEALLEQHLQTNCTEFPYPDLLIRPGGKLRMSNFFLWQVAYTELYFTQSLWPDFGKTDFIDALRSYQQRQRNFGQRNPPTTSESMEHRE